MGMTVDEAIEIFKEIEYPTNGDNEYEREKAIQIMIKAVRKYQKIQEIHKKWFCDYTSAEAYTKISEVIEDGKVD